MTITHVLFGVSVHERRLRSLARDFLMAALRLLVGLARLGTKPAAAESEVTAAFPRETSEPVATR